MRVALAVDHAGLPLKEAIAAALVRGGHEVVDLGAYEPNDADDYPDFAEAVGIALRTGAASRGVLICGSGVGAAIAANKVHGIRACVCHDHYTARQGVEHDHMNVLCLGARVIGVAVATDVVEAFVDAKFSREERHLRRVKKTKALELRRWEPASNPKEEEA
jgi:ribose 5-phosphate isomerase B